MLTWILLVAVGLLGLHVLVIAGVGLRDDMGPADVIVVLGNQVLVSGEPHPRLAARLDAALDCYERGCAPVILVSGGRGKSGFQEADIMRHYLIDRGIPPEAVWLDREGHTTRHTARNAAATMEEQGWNRAIVASQYFHIARSRLALRQAGIGDVGSVHARYVEWRDVYSLGREVVGYWAYFAGART